MAEVKILQALVNQTYELVAAHTDRSFLKAVDPDLWRRCTALQLSRAFTVGSDETSERFCMAPVADLMNHAPLPSRGGTAEGEAGGTHTKVNVKSTMRAGADGVSTGLALVATRDIAKHEELLMSYTTPPDEETEAPGTLLG